MPDPAGEEPIYLVLEDALELYAAIIDASPGHAADHLRNRSGVEAALARPATHADYQNADLVLQAAVLAHGIAEGHHQRSLLSSRPPPRDPARRFALRGEPRG